MKIFSLCFLLISSALSLFVYKIKVLDVPIKPDPNYRAWAVETTLDIKVSGKHSKISMYLPYSNSRGEVLNENFISDGYGLSKINSDFGRRLDWITSRSKGEHSLRYQVLLKPVIKTKPIRVKRIIQKSILSESQIEAANLIVKNAKRVASSATNSEKRLEIELKEIVKKIQDKSVIRDNRKRIKRGGGIA